MKKLSTIIIVSMLVLASFTNMHIIYAQQLKEKNDFIENLEDTQFTSSSSINISPFVNNSTIDIYQNDNIANGDFYSPVIYGVFMCMNYEITLNPCFCIYYFIDEEFEGITNTRRYNRLITDVVTGKRYTQKLEIRLKTDMTYTVIYDTIKNLD